MSRIILKLTKLTIIILYAKSGFFHARIPLINSSSSRIYPVPVRNTGDTRIVNCIGSHYRADLTHI